jgi:hypothetical protein
MTKSRGFILFIKNKRQYPIGAQQIARNIGFFAKIVVSQPLADYVFPGRKQIWTNECAANPEQLQSFPIKSLTVR